LLSRRRAEPAAEADRGRHSGFAGFNVFPGGPGSLAFSFGGDEEEERQTVEPVATYKGTWLEGSYRFDLFPDTLRVVGSNFLRSDSDVSVALAGLQVRVDWLRVRSSLFGAGLCLFWVTLIGCPVAVAALQLDPLGLAAGLLASPGLAGLAMTLAAVRKTEFARFVSDAGVDAVVVPRTRAGDGFEAFIDRVLAQIRDCKGLAEQVASAHRPRDTRFRAL